jgi:hypothetical protein
MAEEVRIWTIGKDNRLAEAKRSKLNLEDRIEDWVSQDVRILAGDLLVIGRQVPTDFGGYIDLLCIRSDGSLVIVELKRDRTPREVTAQALDYASWAQELSADRVRDIANTYLGANGPLEEAFTKRFGNDLPDVINEQHSMLVVASEIDASSERIIRYLSDNYGVSINAVTFNYFQQADGAELVARTFLVSPAQVEQNVRTKSPTKRVLLAPEDVQKAADARGVGELFQVFYDSAVQVFDRPGARKTGLAFKVRTTDGSTKAVLGIVIEKSTASNGLSYYVYTQRLAEHFGLNEQTIANALPADKQPYEYYAGAPAELVGWTGYFRSADEINKFMSVFTDSANSGSAQSA